VRDGAEDDRELFKFREEPNNIDRAGHKSTQIRTEKSGRGHWFTDWDYFVHVGFVFRVTDRAIISLLI